MRGNQKGFSLVELVVAMTVTLIITGAVFQLVIAGKSAFRREPEMADRQQNIRVAMDIISQDVYKAGYGAPTFAQVFTDGLDGAGPAGSGGTDSDILEIFYASECGPTPVCDVPGNGSVSMTLTNELSSCYQLPGLVMVADGTDCTKGRAMIPQQIARGPVIGDIHRFSATAIDTVHIRKGRHKPVRIDVHMTATSGLFQVEEVLMGKAKASPIMTDGARMSKYSRMECFLIHM